MNNCRICQTGTRARLTAATGKSARPTAILRQLLFGQSFFADLLAQKSSQP